MAFFVRISSDLPSQNETKTEDPVLDPCGTQETGKLEPVGCQECGFQFQDPKYFPDHTRWHEHERKRQKIDAERMKSHYPNSQPRLVLKPFSCEYCGWRFILKKDLVHHVRTHTGERPYECAECGKAFPRAHSLTQHKRVHIEGKPFECKNCPKKFRSRTHYIAHCKYTHYELPTFPERDLNSVDAEASVKMMTKDFLVDTNSSFNTTSAAPDAIFVPASSPAPSVTAPSVTAPSLPAPAVPIPAVETPMIDAPAIEALAIEALAIEAPMTDAPTTDAPTIKALTISVPTVSAPTVLSLVDPSLVEPVSPVPISALSAAPSASAATNLQHAVVGGGKRGVRFTCQFCGWGFWDKKDKNQHEWTHTGHKPYYCEVCAKSFARSYSLKLHMRSHTGEKPYSCRHCQRAFAGAGRLANHEKQQHGKKSKYWCPVCRKGFKLFIKFKDHQKEHASSDPALFDLCFPSIDPPSSDHKEPELTDELPPYLSDSAVPCTSSGQGSLLLATLLNKQQTATATHVEARLAAKKPMKYQCQYCGKEFHNKKDCRQHENTHTGFKPYECDVCGLRLSRLYTLKVHMMTRHTGSKPYTCRYCGYTFRDRSGLRSHELMHKRNENYECKLCGKTFKKKTNLNGHLEDHQRNDVDVFQEYYPDGVNFKTPLDRGQGTPNNVRPMRYSCSHCTRQFRDKKDWRHHENTHIGFKPFTCKICNDRFFSGSSLKLHNMQIHAGLSPVICSLCHLAFRDKRELLVHERTRHGDMCHRDQQHKCDICQLKTIKDVQELDNHLRVSHRGLIKTIAEELLGNTQTVITNLLSGDQAPPEGQLSSDCQTDNTDEHMDIIINCLSKRNRDVDVTLAIYVANWLDERKSTNGFPRHECHFCQKGFSKRKDWQQHENTHTGYKPYTCNLCGQKLSRLHSLKQHLLRHKPAQPSVCEQCGAEFKNKSVLEKHQAMHHTLNMAPEAAAVMNQEFEGGPVPSGPFFFKRNELTSRVKHSTSPIDASNSQIDIKIDPASPEFLARPRVSFLKGQTRSYLCTYCRWRFTDFDTFKRHERWHRRMRSTLGRKLVKCNVSKSKVSAFSTRQNLVHLRRTSCNRSEVEALKSGPDEKDNFDKSANREELATSWLHMSDSEVQQVELQSGDFTVSSVVPNETGKVLENQRHPENVYATCRLCHKRFSHGYALKLHLILHVSERPYRCSDCGKRVRSKRILEEHRMTHLTVARRYAALNSPAIPGPSKPTHIQHLPNVSTAAISPVKLPPTTLIQHLTAPPTTLIQRLTAPSTTPNPHIPVPSTTSFPQPRQISVSNIPFAQQQCTPYISTNTPSTTPPIVANLKTEPGPETPIYKGLKLGSDYEARRSKSQSLQPKPHKCVYCGWSFWTRKDCVVHERIHTGEKPYVCQTCGKSFSRSYSLKLHNQTHEGLKPYKCRYCQKGFSSKGYLTVHERIHRNERPHKCRGCRMKFSSRSGLRKHEKRRHKDLEETYQENPPNGSSEESMLRISPPLNQQPDEIPMDTTAKASVFGGVSQTGVCSFCSWHFRDMRRARRHMFWHRKRHCVRFTIKNMTLFILQGNKMPLKGRKPIRCTACEATVFHPIVYKLHDISHRNILPFQCKVCSVKFSRYSGLVRHRSDKHHEFLCPHCELFTKGRKKASRHRRTCRMRRIMTSSKKKTTSYCKICKRQFRGVAAARFHVSRVHAALRPFSCVTCHKGFRSRNKLACHCLKKCTAEIPKRDVVTLSRTDNSNTSSSTIRRTFQPSSHSRQNVSSATPSTTAHHNVTHPNPYQTDKAEERPVSQVSKIVSQNESEGWLQLKDLPQEYQEGLYTNKEGFQEEPNSLIREGNQFVFTKPYPCPYCSSAFAQSFCLKQHVRIHTGEKPFVCPDCGKAFAQKVNLTQHIVVHSGEKPFKCQYCDKRFARKSKVKQHEQIHTGVRPHGCVDCPMKFKTTSELARHRRVHSGDRPHACQECGWKFAARKDMLVHLRTHTGERPFPCPECDMAFARSYSLKRHMRYHTGERPYKCNVCERGFIDASNLRSHQRTHARQKSYDCIKCGLKFQSLDSLEQHRQSTVCGTLTQ